MKKKIRLLTFVICIWMIIGFNIEAMAANNALAIQVNDDFGELIKIIIEIKSKNPEKGNEEIETLIVRQVSMRRDSGVSNIWNSLTDTEKKLVIRYPLDALKVKKALVILDGEDNANVALSTRNIKNVKAVTANAINVYDILKYETVIITKNAVSKIEEVYA